MQEIKRPVLRYHGGKFLLAPWIISHFPPHRIYVECFAGAASVLMQKKRSYGEVYNDRWDIVVNVFRVLRDPDLAKELERLLQLTPYARTEFDEAGDEQINKITDPVEKARRTILRSFAGFGSAATNALHSTGFRANANRSGTTPAMDWNNYPKHIATFVERLKGVTIENKDYRSVIKQHDTAGTLFYLDPPYVHETRNIKRGNSYYVHEFTDQDHEDMAIVLHSIKGMAIVSGYECDLYRYLFADWKRFSKETFADGANERVECLWMNGQAYEKFNRKELFD